MRFLLDEGTEARIAAFLVERGHDVARVGRDHPAGIRDEQVLAIAFAERRILVTNDKDFGELIVRRAVPHAGVILLRFALDATVREKIAGLDRLLATLGDLGGRFLVVRPGGVRER